VRRDQARLFRHTNRSLRARVMRLRTEFPNAVYQAIVD
jgi:hypothetical protein